MSVPAILQSEFWSTFANVKSYLALTGLLVGATVVIARIILRNFRPQNPAQKHGFELAKMIMKYVFILSLVAICFAGVGYLAPLVLPSLTSSTSDLTSAESEASRLQDEVMILKSSWENTEQSPADKVKVLEQSPRLAQQLLAITDGNLRPAWRVLKYEYVLYAYTMAASEAAAGSDGEKQTKLDYIQKGLQAAGTAINLIADIKRNYTTSEDYKKAMRYIQDQEVEDRVNYLSAICLCRKADVLRDEKLKLQARELIAKVSPVYLSKYPVELNTELKDCILRTEVPK